MASQEPVTSPAEHGDESRNKRGVNESVDEHGGRPAASQPSGDSSNVLPNALSAYDIGGSHRDIFWALTCVSLPMLLVTGIFIGLVYANRVSNSADSAENPLATDLPNDSAAYYVNYSAPRLITVSSWASTVASFTATFLMVLISYPVAKNYLRDSKAGSAESLPTVYQLRLIIGVLGGGIGALWSWLQYCSWRKRSKQSRVLWLPALSLLGATILNFAILAVDTWLHVTTSTVGFDAISRVSRPTLSYGRGLLGECYNRTWDSYEVCTGSATAGGYQFPSLSEATMTLTNFSTNNAVLPSSHSNKHFAYLTAAQRDTNVDYLANTFAASTECTPASKICSLQVDQGCNSGGGCVGANLQAGMPYDCGPALYGDLMFNTGTPFNSGETNGTSATSNSSTGFFFQVFEKPSFLDPLGQSFGYKNISNPFYSALGGRVGASNALGADPEAVYNGMTGDWGFIFSCKSTFYDMKYKVINGTVMVESYTPSNNTLPTNAVWTFGNYFAYTQNALQSAFISGAQQANTSQDFANFLGQRSSETLLSMAVGATAESSNLAEQTRERLLVTRLPKAPFFTLLGLNLLYALLGILLAVLALASQPRTTRNVQARLSIGGLVAALLEPHLPEHALASQKRNSGAEGAFAEYYNDDKHTDEGKVLVNPGADNAAFEKIFFDTVSANGHVPAENGNRLPNHDAQGSLTEVQSETVMASSQESHASSREQPERSNSRMPTLNSPSQAAPNHLSEERDSETSTSSPQAPNTTTDIRPNHDAPAQSRHGEVSTVQATTDDGIS
ncbi:hypothetical protein H2200_013057 [Cladophialophora chaetospira]|uniref:Uncharacterized protein n=1 Tax=Cladophialophora chaetospira TaxID=386627 RepID=A0AA38WWN8_9EURO|nr:hypothetical protein H2200_013057 [Cladophialophora chaetospira]